LNLILFCFILALNFFWYRIILRGFIAIVFKAKDIDPDKDEEYKKYAT